MIDSCKKQVIVVRKDLHMKVGKMISQSCHASLEASEKARRRDWKAWKIWRREGAKKVVLKVSSKKELLDYEKKAKRAKLISALIIDAGHTELKPGTVTCLGIGPDKEEKIDKVSGNLGAL